MVLWSPTRLLFWIVCLLCLSIFSPTEQRGSQAVTREHATFIPFLAGTERINEPQRHPDAPSTITLQGVLELNAAGQLVLREPWGRVHFLATENSKPLAVGPEKYLGHYVYLRGQWSDNGETRPFSVRGVRSVTANGQLHASYVAREMSNPADRDSTQTESRTRAQAAGNPHEEGEWSPVQTIGMYALHAVLRPDGKVLFWYKTGLELDNHIYGTILWDPETYEITPFSNESLDGEENWCSPHTQLGDGRLLAVTGNIGAQDPHGDILDHRTNLWTSIPSLHYGRYYPSATFMGDGRVIVSGGDHVDEQTNVAPNPFPEVWENGSWRVFDDPLVTTPTELEFGFFYGSFFPWTQQAPDGQVFYAGPQSTLRYLNPDGSGTVTAVGERDGLSRDYGGYATYDVGKVLVVGGGDSYASAYTINYNQDPPLVEPTGSLAHGRRNFYATLLADGTVLATGGNGDGGTVQASASGAIYVAELWHPDTGTWSEMAAMERRREYHSSALLLPDARVVHAGGDCTPCDPQNNLEIFSPPYLFNPDGSLATRPVIDSAPDEIDYGQLFSVEIGETAIISAVNLIRLGSATHATNFDQRFVPLHFQQADNSLSVTGPLNIFTAPPGYYMLFLISDRGVPAKAHIIKVGAHVKLPEQIIGFGDGGFEESQTPGPNSWITYNTGDTVGGWTVTDGDINIQNLDQAKPADGSGGEQHLDLNGSVPGRISQVVSNLKPGTEYALIFNYATHHLADWATATVTIGDLHQPWLATNDGGEAWLTSAYSFTASMITHTLVFSSNGGIPYAGMLLDEVRIEENYAVTGNGRPPINLALNKPATQSSGGLPAGNAVDGELSGDANSISLTSIDNQPWWQVDLEEIMAIDRIALWNRGDCCQENLGNFYILLTEGDTTGRSLDSLLADSSVARFYVAGAVSASFSRQIQASGRYLRIQSTVPAELGLAEVQLFGPAQPNESPQLVAPVDQGNVVGEVVNLSLGAIDTEQDPLTFIIDNLPTGLTGLSSGQISGIVTVAGTYSPTVVVADPFGGRDEIGFTWIVNAPPTLDMIADQQHNEGTFIDLLLEASDPENEALTFVAENLPPGLALEPVTGEISGTLTGPGSFATEITVTDPRRGSAAISFGWQINGHPLLYSPGNQLHNLHDSVLLPLQATDFEPGFLVYEADSLPPGLNVDPDTGVISGTVMVAGLFTSSLSVEDGGGLSSVQEVGWRVNTPPTLTVPSDLLDQNGESIQMTIVGFDPDGDRVIFRAGGLPTGLSIDERSGLISGTLMIPGTYTATVGIEDEFTGESSASFVWKINDPPQLVHPGDQTTVITDTVHLALTAVDDNDTEALKFASDILPSGLDLDPVAGIISGTPAEAGVYTVTVRANDADGGTGSITFLWTMLDPPPEPRNHAPTLISPGNQTGKVGEAVSLVLSVSDDDDDRLNFAISGLPEGLIFVESLGLIGGTIYKPGTHTVVVEVSDGNGGTDSVEFTWLIAEAEVEVTEPVGGGKGESFELFLPVTRS